MIRTRYFALAVGVLAVACHEPPGATAPSRPLAAAQPADSSHNPTWWNKYLYLDLKSTRLNSSHLVISYAVFCLKKKKNRTTETEPHSEQDPESERTQHQ